MTDSTPTRTTDTSLGRDALVVARYYLGGRRGFFILAAIAVVAGLAFNWSWLVAAGIAPVLVAALPCAAMCALGLCIHRIGERSCAQNEAPGRSAAAGSPDDAASSSPAIDRRPGDLVSSRDSMPAAVHSSDPQSQSPEERRTIDA